jgi:hypothetical protein
MYEDVVGLCLLRLPIDLEMTQSCVTFSHVDSACKHATPEDAHNQASATSPYKPKRTGTKATSTSSGICYTQRCIATHTPRTCAGTAAALLAFVLLHHLLQLLVQGQL